MERRTLLQTASATLMAGLFAGCSKQLNENTDLRGIENNGTNTSNDGDIKNGQGMIDTNFTIINRRCSTGKDLDEVNTTNINFEPSQERIVIKGVIADSQSNRSAELRDTIVKWSDNKLIVGIWTIKNEENLPNDCPIETEYCLIYEYRNQINQSVRVKHNGVTVATAETPV